MRGAAIRDLEAVLSQLSSIGSVIAHGTPSQQKEALAVMFERVEMNHKVEVTRLAPREWAAALFDLMPKEDSASLAGPNSSPVHSMPARGFELTRCTDKNNAGECAPMGWLGLAAGGNALAWRDRAAEMKTMRDQGQTLAAIGERFGLSAERVTQILEPV